MTIKGPLHVRGIPVESGFSPLPVTLRLKREQSLENR